jgi:DNA-binding transcriptional ArsR family regulator
MTREELCKVRTQHIAESFKQLQPAFMALGDETRQQIIMTLLTSDHNGIRVGEITSKTHLSRPAVSHHLKTLRDAGIVNMRREGTMNYYYVDADESQWKQMMELAEYVYEVARDISENGSCRKKEE